EPGCILLDQLTFKIDLYDLVPGREPYAELVWTPGADQDSIASGQPSAGMPWPRFGKFERAHDATRLRHALTQHVDIVHRLTVRAGMSSSRLFKQIEYQSFHGLTN